ncbi:MAG: right-handed parallel beta-helix repeat-containing protein, partial [Methermicoccaceae archaeon]
MRWIISFLIVLYVILFLIQPASATITADITVGEGGDYNTIQEGINAATDGDIVFVYSGTYEEHVVVNKSITLIGEDAGNTEIIWHSGHVVEVIADNAVVKSLTITGAPEYRAGIVVEADGVVVQMCSLMSNGYGLLAYSPNVAVESCTASNNIRYGIALIGGSNYASVSGGDASSNGIAGLFVHDSHDVDISSITINSNGEVGVYFGNVSNSDVTGCVFGSQP